MSGKRQAKRQDLKERLIDAAEARIAENGLAGLRARDVTADAGCALGGLYTVFADLDLLILHVNSRTLARLDIALRDAARDIADPGETLLALACAYLRFAFENRTLWAALFDHRMAEGGAVPDWHLEEHSILIAHIVAPLARLQPHLAGEALAIRARTLFSAVHGIVKISLEDRFVGLPQAELEIELVAFITLLARGMAQGQP